MLDRLSSDIASAISSVDATATHDRWKPGLGPFEEDRQLELLIEAISDRTDYRIKTEVPYPDSSQSCDLVVEANSHQVPVEAKLLRFRYDNGNIDPNAFPKVFSPFPEQSSSSLLTDAQKLTQSGFAPPYGLLGLYYERSDEPYEQINPERIATKVSNDIAFWYELDAKVEKVAHFSGLRHPEHQQGAVITWKITQ